MPSRLKITTEYKSGSWLVTSEVDTDDEDFPTEVFLWTLDDAGALDEFQAIGHIDQVTRYPLYDSNRTSNFGIHLVRYLTSAQTLLSEEDVAKAITVLKSAFQILLDGYAVVSEPVEEFYP